MTFRGILVPCLVWTVEGLASGEAPGGCGGGAVDGLTPAGVALEGGDGAEAGCGGEDGEGEVCAEADGGGVPVLAGNAAGVEAALLERAILENRSATELEGILYLLASWLIASRRSLFSA